MSCKLTIRTDFTYPPIPVRQFDWSATFDDYEPGDLSGHGRTEVDAIRDLIDQWDERREDDAARGAGR